MGSGRSQNLTTGTRESVVVVVLDRTGQGVAQTRDRSEAVLLVTLVSLGPLLQAVVIVLGRHVCVPRGLWYLVDTVVSDLTVRSTGGCCTLLATCGLVATLVVGLVVGLVVLTRREKRRGTFVAVRQDTVASVSVVGLVFTSKPDQVLSG